MMSVLGILSIVLMIISGLAVIIFFICAISEEEFHLLIPSLACLLLFSALLWTQFHDETFKPVMITIAKENITKEKGVYDIKYFKDRDREFKTSDYNDVKYLETLDTNNFLKVCIGYNQPYDMFGYENSGVEAKIVPCDSTPIQ